MPAEVHIEPFRDPRNIAGIIADVWAIVRVDVPSNHNDLARLVTTALTHTRDFSRAPRTALRGAARSGHAALYRRAEQTSQQLISLWNDLYWDRKQWESYFDLADTALNLVITAMTNERPKVGRQVWLEWTKVVLRSGIDGQTLQNIELEWRFKDVTDRRHCGASMRAAFEAAWLAKQYKFARQLVGAKS